MAHLEEPDLALPAVGVEGERAQHPRQQALTQHALVGRERVRHPDPAVDPDPALLVGTEQRRRPGLVGTQSGHDRRAPGAARVDTRVRPPDLRSRRAAPGQVGVSVMARHLFDDVDLALGVGAEGGHRHVEHARRLPARR